MLSALDLGSQVLYGSLVLLYLPVLSALDHKPSMGRLFCCICPCSRHWNTSPLWVACSLIKSHTSPLWVTCFGVGRLFSYQVPHKSPVGHLFRCVWVACSLIKSHTSPLWVTCFGVGRLFSYQVPHKSSVGHLFRYGSLVLLSSPTDKSSVGHLFRCGPLVLFSVCACVCVRVCVCVCVSVCARARARVCVYRKFVQGDYPPCDLALVERSKCFVSSLECRESA
jgi:hypothetical protein